MSLVVNGIEPSSIIVKQRNASGEIISTTEVPSVICNGSEIWSARKNIWMAWQIAPKISGESGSEPILISENGITWHRYTWNKTTGYPVVPLGGICYNDKKWILAPGDSGYKSIRMSKDDGKTWQDFNVIPSTASTQYTGIYGGVQYCNGKYFACSSSETDYKINYGFGICYSEDGETWLPTNLINTGGTANYGFTGGVHCGKDSNGNDVWVACGNVTTAISKGDSGLWYSYDGITWNPCTVKNISSSTAVSKSWLGGARYANGIWVACGCRMWGSQSGFGLYYSTDGVSWVQASQDLESQFMSARYADGIWVAATGDGGSHGAGIYYSETGKSWTRAKLSSGYFLTDDFSGGAWHANGTWVACSCIKGIYYSDDGKTWAAASMPTSETYTTAGGARYADGVWVCACGNSGQGGRGILYSEDNGRTWKQSNVIEGNSRSRGLGLMWSTITEEERAML